MQPLPRAPRQTLLASNAAIYHFTFIIRRVACGLPIVSYQIFHIHPAGIHLATDRFVANNLTVGFWPSPRALYNPICSQSELDRPLWRTIFNDSSMGDLRYWF
jgi:hypothetical protein